MLYNSIGVPSWVCRCFWYRGLVPVQVPLLPMAHQAPGGWRRLHLWRLVEFRRPIMAHAMALQTVDGGEILPLIDGLSMVIPLFIGFQHVSTIQDWWLAGFRNHPQFNIYICAEKPPNYRYLMTFGDSDDAKSYRSSWLQAENVDQCRLKRPEPTRNLIGD